MNQFCAFDFLHSLLPCTLVEVSAMLSQICFISRASCAFLATASSGEINNVPNEACKYQQNS